MAHLHFDAGRFSYRLEHSALLPDHEPRLLLVNEDLRIGWGRGLGRG